MPVSTLPSAQEFEEKGWADIEFVGIKYVGERSTRSAPDIPQRAGYGGPAQFQQGRTYFALLPTWLDEENVENHNIGVHALESRNDFEVIYDAERLAAALLDRNYLPTDVFYEGFVRWKRQKVLEKLDLEAGERVYNKDDEEPYRNQLREIANIERDDEAGVSKTRAEEYVSRFSRSDLSDIVKVLRRDSDEIDLRTAGQTDMAEYLTRFESETVEQGVDVAHGDGDQSEITYALEDSDASTDGSEADDESSDDESE